MCEIVKSKMKMVLQDIYLLMLDTMFGSETLEEILTVENI